MTRDDIISMYEKANGWCPTEWDETVKDLERFAELVAAAEREACAKVCDVFAVSAFDDEAGIALNIQKSIRARGQV